MSKMQYLLKIRKFMCAQGADYFQSILYDYRYVMKRV